MFIFLLCPKYGFKVPNYDAMRKCVVIADDEKKARKLAANVCGDEGVGFWASSESSHCLELAPVETPFNSPQVLCRDFNAG